MVSREKFPGRWPDVAQKNKDAERRTEMQVDCQHPVWFCRHPDVLHGVSSDVQSAADASDNARRSDLGQAVSGSLYHGFCILGLGTRDVHDRCTDLQVCG